ncbi:MFS transporter [Actinoallomurus rhizosphaericola]|uniref:MFS transporter n=1 Tax=Actinoallomurus rhizosphaericola TaxID=2952536 RepID=UPI0020912B0E|nr:MFS transporter [Actinoallomurus rhizosphaericola]MCO5993132.1 MFS transporter [Actinoallomurus rhizosphaericola]
MSLWSRTGAAGRAVRAVARRTARATRRATHAGGAGGSGLGALIELNALNSAGDALIAVALAGTMFFNLDVQQARGQVALYLLVTMAPFALVAPLIGPVLDRMRHARRIAIAGTMLARGLLCWGMAGAVLHKDPVTLMPAAFGALVLSKAFGVSRNAVTPRVLPPGLGLVTANARASFTGVVAASVMAPVGAGLVAVTNAGWVLRAATVLFMVGAISAMRLPSHVDTPAADAAPDRTEDDGGTGEAGDRTDGRGRWRTLLRVGPVVSEAMLANAALRAFAGFLILYLAFLLRTKGFVDAVSPNIALGMLAAAAGAGGLAGTGLGALVKERAPRAILFGTLLAATVTAAVCAAFFGLIAALVVAFVGALGQSLGKLGLDAIVQREVGEEIRSSTFAVTETVHQLVWVVGGLIGLGMSIVAANGHVALAVVAGALALSLVTLAAPRRSRRAVRRRERAAEGEPSVADTTA